ncbi:hypothetical protein B0T19DRAFT_440846 [Cercophora scortea]|uniref:Uncharacterized protein n=1 Tax=Cercophora scortea TaxID=314031 RepID=A0AAE0J008_9PEZI|nr:hypothetical protein B0T19DRAFT_440846 [Cercophora scortea]
MNCTLSEVCPGCGESLLSTASSVIGFLTFGIGFIFAVIAFATVARNADNEIKNLTAIVFQTNEHINCINSSLGQLVVQGDPILDKMLGLIQPSLGGFRQAHADAQEYLESFKKLPSGCKRVSWWFYEKETAATMARLESYKQHFTAIQITFLMRKLEAQSDNIALLRRDVRERISPVSGR